MPVLKTIALQNRPNWAKTDPDINNTINEQGDSISINGNRGEGNQSLAGVADDSLDIQGEDPKKESFLAGGMLHCHEA